MILRYNLKICLSRRNEPVTFEVFRVIIHSMRSKLSVLLLLVFLFSAFSLKEFVPSTLCIHMKEGVVHLEKDYPQSPDDKEEIHIKLLSEVKIFKISIEDKSFAVNKPAYVDLNPLAFRKINFTREKVKSFDSPVKTVRLLI